MALKFLNKKGWHTGSLRNIENVWKAEQKRDAEQKKLEELRVQIQQERERSEFRALQEQAGLVPAQERLDFLYDSGLSVGKGGGSSSGTGVAFQSLDQPANADTGSNNNNDNKQQPSAPGALFEDKPQSANDAWRKLHSDPLLLIRQREQEALARLKNNPVQMALIRQSVQEKKPKEKARDKKDRKKKHRHSSSKHHKHSSSKHHSDSEEGTDEETYRRKSNEHKASRSYEKQSHNTRSDSEDELKKRESRKETRHKESYRENSSTRLSEREKAKNYGQDDRRRDKGESERGKAKNHGQDNRRRDTEESDRERHSSRSQITSDRDIKDRGDSYGVSRAARESESQPRKRRGAAPKLSEEERAARLREMQMDAQLHEEQRWKRLKKAEEADAEEAKRNSASSRGKNFLDDANKRVYGTEKGGSSTIEESVRRRMHYSQRGFDAEGNAFRR